MGEYEGLKQRLRQQPKFYGLGDCCKEAADAIESLEARITALTGEKFSDRNHAALKSRAEAAEKELAQWRERWEKANTLAGSALGISEPVDR
jgi:hypothetical protein